MVYLKDLNQVTKQIKMNKKKENSNVEKNVFLEKKGLKVIIEQKSED